MRLSGCLPRCHLPCLISPRLLRMVSRSPLRLIPRQVQSGMSRLLSFDVLIWTFALSAIPNLSSALSNPVPQKPFRLSRKMLSSLVRCLGKHVGIPLLPWVAIHMTLRHTLYQWHSEDVQVVSVSYIYDILLHLVGILYHVRMILP